MSKVIRFNYLYRDSGNWKKFGSKRFSNPDQLQEDEIEKVIRQNLIDQEYFYPNQVGIKKFKFHRYLDDYLWYEFESIEIVDDTDPPMKELESISTFLLRLKKPNYSDVFIMGDQPTTCPKCGSRTEILSEILDYPAKIQYHKCLSVDCKYTFIQEEDKES